jgi:TolB-like protein
MVEKLHVSAGALHLWSVGIDARAVLMIFGVALIAGDILWRRHLRPVPVPSSAPSPPTVERGSIAVLPAANLSGDAGRTEEGFWVAVLPFKYGGGNADLISLAEALSDEIVAGLSRFSYLRVISRSSTSRNVNATADVRTIGREIGARYVMEGSLHQAGTRVRLAVQLVDAVSGAHLWAENYERTFSSDLVFELQDDLAARIVSTVADIRSFFKKKLKVAGTPHVSLR